MNIRLAGKPLIGLLFFLMIGVGCASVSSLTTGKTTKGVGGTDVTELTRCARPIGTAALLETDSPFAQLYTQLGLTSPIPLVKLMMTRSGCFRVVDRGATSDMIRAERALAAGGELEKGSNMGGGQMVAADYIINPQIVHRDANAGGGAVGLGGLLPGAVGVIAGAFGKKKLEAQVMLTVTNVRTGVQEAVVEGSATKSDLTFAGIALGGSVAGAGGVYESTDIGKIVAIAFMDAHNKLVAQLGGIAPESADTQTRAGYITSAQLNFRTGPSSDSPIIGTLHKGASVVPTGIRQGSWWEVEALGKTGWVHSNYLTR